MNFSITTRVLRTVLSSDMSKDYEDYSSLLLLPFFQAQISCQLPLVQHYQTQQIKSRTNLQAKKLNSKFFPNVSKSTFTFRMRSWLCLLNTSTQYVKNSRHMLQRLQLHFRRRKCMPMHMTSNLTRLSGTNTHLPEKNFPFPFEILH